MAYETMSVSLKIELALFTALVCPKLTVYW